MAANRDKFFKDLAAGVKWSAGVAFNRTNALPLDDNSVFDSEASLQTYLTRDTSTAYPGQVVAVVEADKTTFYGINQNGEAIPIGSGSSTTHVVDSKQALTELTDAKKGEQAYVNTEGVDGGMYILTQDDPSDISHWSKVSSDVTWNTGNKINFSQLNFSEYNSGNKDANTLYVVKDASKIFLGSVDVTSDIRLVGSGSFPEKSSALKDKIYIDKTSFEMRVIDPDSEEYIVISPGYVTDGENWAQSTDDSKLATIEVIKAKITEAISTATSTAKITKVTDAFTQESGKLKTTIHQGSDDISSTEVELTGVAHNPTYDESKLTINVYGSTPVEVDFSAMLKDKFLKSAKYVASYDPSEYQEANPELEGKQVIVFTIENGTTPLVVDVSALVDTYESGSQPGDTISVTVGEGKISATLNISSSADGNLVTTDADGKLVAKSAEDAVGEAISEAINTALSSGEIKEALDKKMNTLGDGQADEVILSDVGGAVKRSGKKLGSTSLSEAGDETLVAMESAVIEALTLGAIE